VDIVESAVPDAFVVIPKQHRDDRGVFLECYRFDLLAEALGYSLDLRQANCSVSAAGVLRGIHSATLPPGQAKYVTCAQGAVLDVIVDIRAGSPTFGQWDSVQLDDRDRKAIYISEGLGHAFISLTDGATVVYMCSDVYSPGREFGINPLDPDIGIAWPRDLKPNLSEKDEAAPTLADAVAAGTLPSYEECQAHYRALASASKA
jgi:dTDP-4-dehydrorhamnose 3,5-epimerase